MKVASFTRIDFCKQLLCGPLYVMLSLLVVEAALSAGTTYLVIQTGKDLANDEFVLTSLIWILVVQATSYVVGAISWLFAERAGFGAFGRYMHRFAKINRGQPTLLSDRHQREATEPFLTNESFHIYFELMYEVESVLRLFLSLVFNAIVLGMEIDGSLPITYAVVFVVCVGLQFRMRNVSANAYLENQRRTNRMTAHSYTAWDNIFSGNRYSYRLWNFEFKSRLRAALRAQIRAIMIREGMSSAFGILSLAIVFAGIVLAAYNANHDTAILVALATTIPRQIDLSHTVLGLAEGGNDLIAIWSRIGGAVEHFALKPDAKFAKRVKAPKLTLSEHGNAIAVHSPEDAINAVRRATTGRINVRGGNGSGKSSLLALLKNELGAQAFYWPTTDRLAFEFAARAREAALAQAGNKENDDDEGDGEHSDAPDAKKLGFSAGEWQIRTLKEIVEKTNARYYLLDEWDANLDGNNRAIADALMNELAARARVVEISHRDGKALSA
jgi:hypothetical protein